LSYPAHQRSALYQLNAINSDDTVSSSKVQIPKSSSFQLREILILLKYSLREQNYTHLPSADSGAINVILTHILVMWSAAGPVPPCAHYNTQHSTWRLMSSTSKELTISPDLLLTVVPRNHENPDCTVLWTHCTHTAA